MVIEGNGFLSRLCDEVDSNLHHSAEGVDVNRETKDDWRNAHPTINFECVIGFNKDRANRDRIRHPLDESTFFVQSDDAIRSDSYMELLKCSQGR